MVGAAGNVAPISTTFQQNGIAFVANAGKQWLDLTGGSSNQAIGVAQTIKTTRGASYRLSFAVGTVVDPGGPFAISSTVNVLVNGHKVLAATNKEGGKVQAWKTFAVTIKAVKSATTIEFQNGDGGSDNDNGPRRSQPGQALSHTDSNNPRRRPADPPTRLTRVQPTPTARLQPLRYDGVCSSCHSQLARRTRAWWYPDEKKFVCTSCRPAEIVPDAAPATGNTLAVEEEPAQVEPLTVDGEGGASARREGERRRAKRERETLTRHPRLGKLILAVSDEPQSVRSWGKGAVGEEALGAKLNTHASERVVVLHDRKIPGSRSNIDHLVIAPGGVFVIDAKHYSGRVEQRNLGNIFRSDVRLYVGRRECTKLLHGSEDQAEVVRDAVASLGYADIPVRPVLCFVGAEWGLFPKPFKLGSVLITFPKFLYELIAKNAEVETAAIQETARHLADILRRA